MPGGSTKPSEYDPDYSHSIRGDVGLPEDDGYHLYGSGDPEGDLIRGKAAAWTANFHDRRRRDQG